jgi:flagellar protein FlaG
MSNMINSANGAGAQYANSVLPAPTPPVASGAPKVNIPSDAEVVSKVISTQIKPSSVAETAQSTRAAIDNAARELESFVHSMGRSINISVDGNTGYHVVTVTNPDTGEVIRQMPSPELLKIAQSLPKFDGLFLNRKA